MQSSSLNNIIGCPNYEGALHRPDPRIQPELQPLQLRSQRKRPTQAPLVINVISRQPTTFMTMTKESSTSGEVIAACLGSVGGDILKTDVLGRITVGSAQREAILDAFESSGM